MEEYFSLDGYVVSANAALFTAVRALLPDASDPRVLDGGNSSFQIGETTDLVGGNPVLAFMIRFNSDKKGDRDSIFSSLEGLSGMFNQCLDGTWVGYHTCGNYKDPTEPCNQKELYRSKWNGISSTVSHIINGVQQ